MATPTISEYTAHLRQDKATMRDHLLNANITTKESDTFTDLTRIALEKGNAIRRIYVQPGEPAAKHGLWFKRDAVEDFDVVSDPVPFVGDTLSAFNASYNPDSAYDKVKETRTVRANNTVYYLAIDNHKDSYPDEAFRIYKYDPYTNTYTKIQTYTANEVYNVRGDGGYYAISVFRKNGVVCIDSEGEYLYLICGGYDTNSESQKYITRFGLKTHSAARVHTKLSNWFPIPAGDLSNAQIVDNKIYIFGQSTNAAAYGNVWNTRIIDLTTGSESTLNNGPVAYQGRTVKVNSHLIAGFGGGNVSMNSGQGMTDVRLFDTLTNTTTKIATLTNRNNSRVLTVVGNLIYFVEYRNSGSSSKSVGYVNLVDNSVTYIDDVFTPKLQNIATSSSLYLPSARAILLGNYVGQTYSYNLDTKPYNKDTVVLFQSTGIAAQYVVDLFTTNNFKTDVPFNISDAWFYRAGEGLETTGEVYYGNGTEWLPLVHGNTNGGVNALQLQHKTVEITDNATTHVIPDPGFEGLRYVDIVYKGHTGLNVYTQPDEPESKVGVWLQTTNKYSKVSLINGAKYDGTVTTKTSRTKIPWAFKNGTGEKIGDFVYLFGGTSNDNLRGSTTAYKYDLVNDTYTKLTNTTYTNGFSPSVAVDNYIYLFGTWDYYYCYRYNILTDKYESRAKPPYNRTGSGMVAVGKYIYAFGSDNGEVIAKCVDKYNTETNTWSTITTAFTTAIVNPHPVAVGTNIYLIASPKYSGDIMSFKFDTVTDTWETISNPPDTTFLTGTAIAVDADTIFIATAASKVCYLYHISTDTYTRLTDLPRGISNNNNTIFAYNGSLLSFGGSQDMQGIFELTLGTFADTTEYEDDTVVITHGTESDPYFELFSTLNLISSVDIYNTFHFSDVYYVTQDSNIDDTIPTYYGNGTEWIKFKN